MKCRHNCLGFCQSGHRFVSGNVGVCALSRGVPHHLSECVRGTLTYGLSSSTKRPRCLRRSACPPRVPMRGIGRAGPFGCERKVCVAQLISKPCYHCPSCHETPSKRSTTLMSTPKFFGSTYQRPQRPLLDPGMEHSTASINCTGAHFCKLAFTQSNTESVWSLFQPK